MICKQGEIGNAIIIIEKGTAELTQFVDSETGKPKLQ